MASLTLTVPKLTSSYRIGCMSIALGLAGAWLAVQGAGMAMVGQCMAFVGLLLAVHFGIIFCFRSSREEWFGYTCLHISVALGLLHFFATAYTDYAHDINGHVAYIAQLAAGRLPPPLGWQTQQPPLYYALAALVLRFGQALHMAQPAEAVRLLSVVLYTGFLLLSVDLLRSVLSASAPRAIAVAMVLFWPEGFNVMSRISNDGAMLLLDALVLWALVRWHQERRKGFLALAVAAASLALAVKGTGIAACAAVALTIAYALKRGRLDVRLLRPPAVVALGMLAAACAALNFGRIAYWRFVKNAPIHWFSNIDRAQIGPQMPGDAAYRYLYLDYGGFLKDHTAFSNQASHESFWNIFLKTLLLGEWDWKLYPLVGIMSFLLLVILGLSATLLLRDRWPNDFLVPPAIMAACLVGASIAAFVTLPWGPVADARYAFALITIVALFYGAALEWHRAEGRVALHYGGLLAGVLFSAGGIALLAGLTAKQ